MSDENPKPRPKGRPAGTTKKELAERDPDPSKTIKEEAKERRQIFGMFRAATAPRERGRFVATTTTTLAPQMPTPQPTVARTARITVPRVTTAIGLQPPVIERLTVERPITQQINTDLDEIMKEEELNPLTEEIKRRGDIIASGSGDIMFELPLFVEDEKKAKQREDLLNKLLKALKQNKKDIKDDKEDPEDKKRKKLSKGDELRKMFNEAGRKITEGIRSFKKIGFFTTTSLFAGILAYYLNKTENIKKEEVKKISEQAYALGKKRDRYMLLRYRKLRAENIKNNIEGRIQLKKTEEQIKKSIPMNKKLLGELNKKIKQRKSEEKQQKEHENELNEFLKLSRVEQERRLQGRIPLSLAGARIIVNERNKDKLLKDITPDEEKRFLTDLQKKHPKFRIFPSEDKKAEPEIEEIRKELRTFKPQIPRSNVLSFQISTEGLPASAIEPLPTTNEFALTFRRRRQFLSSN